MDPDPDPVPDPGSPTLAFPVRIIVYRAPEFLASRPTWVPHSLPRKQVWPPFRTESGVGATLAYGWGGGGTQFEWQDKSLAICMLYGFNLFRPKRRARIYRVHGREYWMVYSRPNFLRSYDSAPRPAPSPPLLSASWLSFSFFLCVAGRTYWRERGGGGGQESLALYKSFTLWCMDTKAMQHSVKKNTEAVCAMVGCLISWKRSQSPSAADLYT